MLVYYFVPFIVSNRFLLFRDSNGHNSVTVQNRTHVYVNFFDHKDLGNHLLQLCPKVVKHPVLLLHSIGRPPTYLMDFGVMRHYDRCHEAQCECKFRILYLGGHVLCSLQQISNLEVTV